MAGNEKEIAAVPPRQSLWAGTPVLTVPSSNMSPSHPGSPSVLAKLGFLFTPRLPTSSVSPLHLQHNSREASAKPLTQWHLPGRLESGMTIPYFPCEVCCVNSPPSVRGISGRQLVWQPGSVDWRGCWEHSFETV